MYSSKVVSNIGKVPVLVDSKNKQIKEIISRLS